MHVMMLTCRIFKKEFLEFKKISYNVKTEACILFIALIMVQTPEVPL